jgi:hypothetical protein
MRYSPLERGQGGLIYVFEEITANPLTPLEGGIIHQHLKSIFYCIILKSFHAAFPLGKGARVANSVFIGGIE